MVAHRRDCGGSQRLGVAATDGEAGRVRIAERFSLATMAAA
jgi:hypothetical protein